MVSDYAAGGPKAWENLRGTLRMLAQQEFAGRAEFLYVENEKVAAQVPADVLSTLPGVRVVVSPDNGSYELKNAGFAAARGEIACILDADCRPEKDWLAAIAAAWKARPEASVISGRTNYEAHSLMDRISALLSRAYVDRGGVGATRYISNNNSSWRRAVYLKHPLPTGLGPFAGRTQSEAILRDGGILLFDPSIRVIHEFEGWPMEADIRRNVGFGSIIARLHDANMPWAGLVRLGRLSIPFFAAGRMIHSWTDCLRCWRVFGLRMYQLPVALFMAAVVVCMETPGMWAAFAHKGLATTEYR